METEKATETVPRPYCSERLNKRDAVWYQRHVSAWELADMTGGATAEHVEECGKLLDSIQRHALAAARHWEADNDPRNFDRDGKPRPAHQREEERLQTRCTKLKKRLEDLTGGALRLESHGLYLSVVDKRGRDMYMLHWFD